MPSPTHIGLPFEPVHVFSHTAWPSGYEELLSTVGPDCPWLASTDRSVSRRSPTFTIATKAASLA